MSTMKEKPWTVLVISVILQCFGEVDVQSVHLVPSPIAEVKEGENLTLNCNCSGSKTPNYINWYLNNDTDGLVIKASSCNYLTTPGQYETDRYTISCHETKFDLSIANISKAKDHRANWKCDTTVMGMVPPQKASTRIFVKDADAYSVHMAPYPVAEVTEGNTLTLQCSYEGSNNPDIINWILNNDTIGLVIDASSCKYLINPEQYEIDRYSISCHETKFNLSISNISKEKDHHDTWKCDTTVIGINPQQKASTTIVVIDAVPPVTKSGQHNNAYTVVAVAVPVVAVVAVGTILVALRYKKRRNDWVKNMKKKNYDQHQERREMLGVTGLRASPNCMQASAKRSPSL